MKRFLLVSVLLAGCGSTVGSASPIALPYQYLWPEDGPFALLPQNNRYLQAVAEVLFRGRRYRRRLLMVAMGIDPPAATWIEEIPEGEKFNYRVVHVQAESSIWNAVQSGEPLIGVPTATTEGWIDATAFERIDRTWSLMTTSVRHEMSRPAVLDGSDYHFLVVHPGEGTRAGYTSSPPDNTRAMALVHMAEMLAEYSRANERERAVARDKILSAVDEFDKNP